MNKVKNPKVGHLLSKYGIIFVLVAMCVGITIINPKFASITNITNVLTQSSIYGIMALGMTFIIIAKGIDLSAGSILALTGVVYASLAQIEGATGKFYEGFGTLPIIVPIVVCLIVGLVLGGINGALVAKTGIPAFIATLGMQTIARGLTLIYTGGKPISNLSSGAKFFGSTLGSSDFPIPVPVLIYILMIIISWVLLNYTRFGKYIYAIGGNIKAAEISGVNVAKTQIKVFAFGGLMFAVAAIVFAGRTGSVHPGAATGYELTAIAATTIGGTSQTGGIGTIWGAVAGALVIAVLRNGLTILGVDAYWQQIAEGLIIIGAVIIDMRKNSTKK